MKTDFTLQKSKGTITNKTSVISKLAESVASFLPALPALVGDYYGLKQSWHGLWQARRINCKQPTKTPCNLLILLACQLCQLKTARQQTRISNDFNMLRTKIC